MKKTRLEAGLFCLRRSVPAMHAVADIDVPQAMPGVDPAPAAATVIVRVESAPEAAVEADAVKAVKAAMETAMADEVAATKAANGEMVATNPWPPKPRPPP
jgi:hypothetical protein